MQDIEKYFKNTLKLSDKQIRVLMTCKNNKGLLNLAIEIYLNNIDKGLL